MIGRKRTVFHNMMDCKVNFTRKTSDIFIIIAVPGVSDTFQTMRMRTHLVWFCMQLILLAIIINNPSEMILKSIGTAVFLKSATHIFLFGRKIAVVINRVPL